MADDKDYVEMARELWWPHHISRTRKDALDILDAGSDGEVTLDFDDFVNLVKDLHRSSTVPTELPETASVVVKRSMRGRAHSEDSNLIVLPAQVIIDAISETKLPRQNWSCSDDASGTALTLGRQRTYIVNVIKKLFRETLGSTTTLEYENQRLRKALKAARGWVVTCSESSKAQDDLKLIDEVLK